MHIEHITPLLAQAEILAGLGCLLWLVMMALALGLLVFWILMLIDAIRNPALDDTMRIVWVLVIIFTNWIGALIYYFIGRNPT